MTNGYNGGVAHTNPAATVDTHHGGSSIMAIFCVGLPLFACGLLIYFGMKRVFAQIDESEE